MRVRYRVDGELQSVMTIPNHIEEAVVARIKVMADMDTTENRRPQDGRLSVHEGGRQSEFPRQHDPDRRRRKGRDAAVGRDEQDFRHLEHSGLTDRDLKLIQSLIDKPHGMIVVTGPTGSGKSTTMYALLSKLNAVSRNIVTVEDPVEYRLSGVNQVASDNEHGLGFANALKYIMRQDPDVIMVGEIRDHETAATAVQAALTGHLLISTLHTNDALGSIARLNDLGIDRFKIGGSLLGAVAQRLLRKICSRMQGTGRTERIAAEDADCKGQADSAERGFLSRPRLQEVPRHRATRADCRFSRRMVITPAIAEAIENGVPATRFGKSRCPREWSSSRPPAWSKCSPGGRRSKKCSTSSPASARATKGPAMRRTRKIVGTIGGELDNSAAGGTCPATKPWWQCFTIHRSKRGQKSSSATWLSSPQPGDADAKRRVASQGARHAGRGRAVGQASRDAAGHSPAAGKRRELQRSPIETVHGHTRHRS